MNRIKEAYTAQELAPLLGKTERGIRFIGKRDNWDRRLRSGRSDDFEYPTIKLPADVSLEEAGLMYVQGIDKLSAGDAVKLLKGAWTLTVTRKNGDDMRLRYADFASGTIEKAVQGAMQVEGLENAEVTDSGVDDSGNTYQAGVVSTDNGTYNWRVSVIELDEVYDISGLPNTAFYVGIRFTAQA